MVTRTPMTSTGHKRLQEELKRLKGPERVAVVRAIEEARAHGDLSENAEYDAAKNAQGLLEARIREVESKLATAQVIDISTLSGNKVVFGATVELQDMDSDEARTVKIVGEDEADADQGLISYNSPLSRALIGKETDDVVEVRLPGGKREYEVVGVRFEGEGG